MNKHIFESVEDLEREKAEVAAEAEAVALIEQLDLIAEISAAIEVAMHAFTETQPDREVMKAKAVLLLKIAKDVLAKVNDF